MNVLDTLLSVLLAIATALVIGPILGRLATQWFSGRGLTNLLMEVRGTFLPFLLAPALGEATGWSAWLTIGTVVGFNQAIAVSRWIARHTGQWSPSIVGALALGRSRAALLSARTMERGAIVAQLGATGVQVIVLEAVLFALELPSCHPVDSVGGALYSGAGTSLLFVFGLGTGIVFGTEIIVSRLLQRRARSATSSADPGASQG